MKTLSEIKEEYAKELGWNGWHDLLLNADGTRQILDSDYNEVSKLYAKEVARGALKNASENARMSEEGVFYCECGHDHEYYNIDKYSILNEENIPKL